MIGRGWAWLGVVVKYLTKSMYAVKKTWHYFTLKIKYNSKSFLQAWIYKTSFYISMLQVIKLENLALRSML